MLENKRIEYIDAMRGFTMILVVFAHVEIFGFFNFCHETIVGQLFQSFRMPLFFFTSGFVTYRANKVWDKYAWRNESIRRIRIQLIPTLVFGLFYTYVIHHSNYIEFFSTTDKCGYWFTISLLEILLFYYTYNYITNSLKWNEKKHDFILFGIGIVLYFLKMPMKTVGILDVIGNYTSLHYTFTYIQFFILGVLVSKHRHILSKIMDNGRWMAYIIILFITLFCCKLYLSSNTLFSHQIIEKIIETIFMSILGYLGICVVFAFFRKNKQCFETKESRWIKYVGTHTLDIYMIHYFLLPSLPMIGTFLINTNNVIIELLIGLSLSLVIVVVCLIISNILRLSDTLAHYLFGKKTTNNS